MARANGATRAIALVFGGWVAVSVAGLGVFLEMVAVSAAAGLFTGTGVFLYSPPLVRGILSGESPSPTDGDRLGTGLHREATGMALAIGGIGTLFAGFVFEDAPAIPVAVGLGFAAVCYPGLAWVHSTLGGTA